MSRFSSEEQFKVMKVQEVILRAMSGKISWLDAAEILRWSPRTLRRWRWRYEQQGYDGLFDRRKGRPSPKRVPMKTAERVLRLYREEYSDFNVRHFHEKLLEQHGIELSYQWVKCALQTAGLVEKRRRQEPHRRQRERRPMRGMLLHVDGSEHDWLAGQNWKQDLIAFLDDATSEVYCAYLVEEEGTLTVMTGLKELIEKHGLFCSLYSDRGSHFFYTDQAGGAVDKTRLTQIGRALAQLGIEHIPSYSPQARGRMERFYETWQGRLPQELRKAGITEMAPANQYIRQQMIPWHNRKLAVAPKEEGSAFVPARGADLEGILCVVEDRVVNQDNTVSWGKRKLQLEAVGWRSTLAKCRVKVCEHVDGRLSVCYGPQVVGWYDTQGQNLNPNCSKPLEKKMATSSPEHDEFFALNRDCRAFQKQNPAAALGCCQRNAFLQFTGGHGRSGCTPAEPYPPSRESMLQKRTVDEQMEKIPTLLE
jgi:transposase